MLSMLTKPGGDLKSSFLIAEKLWDNTRHVTAIWPKTVLLIAAQQDQKYHSVYFAQVRVCLQSQLFDDRDSTVGTSHTVKCWDVLSQREHRAGSRNALAHPVTWHCGELIRRIYVCILEGNRWPTHPPFSLCPSISSPVSSPNQRRHADSDHPWRLQILDKEYIYNKGFICTDSMCFHCGTNCCEAALWK